jgi:hypothetical protein
MGNIREDLYTFTLYDPQNTFPEFRLTQITTKFRGNEFSHVIKNA